MRRLQAATLAGSLGSLASKDSVLQCSNALCPSPSAHLRSEMSTEGLYCQRRTFVSGADRVRERQLRKSLIPSSGLSGRNKQSVVFEKRISLSKLGCGSDDPRYPYDLLNNAGAFRLGGSNVARESSAPTINALQQAAMVPGTAVVANINIDPTALWEGSLEGKYDRTLARRLTSRTLACLMPIAGNEHIIFSLEPLIDSHEFAYEEAQVELMNTYRNMLVEVAEAKNINRLALIPLCLASSGRRHSRSIIKLNQVSLIKSFHRIAEDDKEELLYNRPNFGVDMYVPDDYYEEFISTFSEEAWAAPESVFMPGRLDLYPGLAPPKGMLEMEGWVGKRPELVEAVYTNGKSMLEGTKYALDGTPIEKLDASTFGSNYLPSMRERIQLEYETARKQGYIPKEPAPLGTGLEGDAYQPDVKPVNGAKEEEQL